MKPKILLQYILIFIASLAILTGCGGSSSNREDDSSDLTTALTSNQTETNSEQTTAKIKGYLIDSPLSGVTYECDGNEALTDSNGTFECIAPPVTFKIGNLTLGTLNAFTADGKVYPQDLLGLDRDNYSDSRLKLLARLMQSLDDDGNISKKISITQSIRDGITDTLDFDKMSESDITALLSKLGKSLVNECGALEHLGASGLNCNSDGSYYVYTSEGGSSSSIPINPRTYQKSISIKTTKNKIVAYELQIHCLDNLPNNSDINIAPNEISASGRVVTILGVNVDESKQNIKIAVASSGTQDGTNFISKAIEFNGCTDASIVNEIVVDSSANKIDNPEILISE